VCVFLKRPVFFYFWWQNPCFHCCPTGGFLFFFTLGWKGGCFYLFGGRLFLLGFVLAFPSFFVVVLPILSSFPLAHFALPFVTGRLFPSFQNFAYLIFCEFLMVGVVLPPSLSCPGKPPLTTPSPGPTSFFCAKFFAALPAPPQKKPPFLFFPTMLSKSLFFLSVSVGDRGFFPKRELFYWGVQLCLGH